MKVISIYKSCIWGRTCIQNAEGALTTQIRGSNGANRHVSKKDIQVASNPIKQHATSSDIRKWKALVHPGHTVTSVDKGMEKLQLTHVSRSHNMGEPLWKTVWKFGKELTMEFLRETAIPFLGIPLQIVYRCVEDYNSITHNNSKAETVQTSTNWHLVFSQRVKHHRGLRRNGCRLGLLYSTDALLGHSIPCSVWSAPDAAPC